MRVTSSLLDFYEPFADPSAGRLTQWIQVTAPLFFALGCAIVCVSPLFFTGHVFYGVLATIAMFVALHSFFCLRLRRRAELDSNGAMRIYGALVLVITSLAIEFAVTLFVVALNVRIFFGH